MNLPDKMFVKRSEVRLFLGLSESAMTKMVRSGVLKPKYFPGMSYAYYERSEVLQVKGTLESTTEAQRHRGKF